MSSFSSTSESRFGDGCCAGSVSGPGGSGYSASSGPTAQMAGWLCTAVRYRPLLAAAAAAAGLAAADLFLYDVGAAGGASGTSPVAATR